MCVAWLDTAAATAKSGPAATAASIETTTQSAAERPRLITLDELVIATTGDGLATRLPLRARRQGAEMLRRSSGICALTHARPSADDRRACHWRGLRLALQ